MSLFVSTAHACSLVTELNFLSQFTNGGRLAMGG